MIPHITNNVLVLMTRIPIPHKTKTRLIGVLSAEEVATLHTCFIQDICSTLYTLPKDISIVVSYSDEAPNNDIAILQDTIDETKISYFLPQQGADLGERQHHIFSTLCKAGANNIIVIGSDIPHLSLSTIEQGFACLSAPHQVVIGPTYDGGYYLLGMNALYESLLKGTIAWGTTGVLSETMAMVIQESQECKINMLDYYHDIDTWEDLEKVVLYCITHNVGLHTRNYLTHIQKMPPISLPQST